MYLPINMQLWCIVIYFMYPNGNGSVELLIITHSDQKTLLQVKHDFPFNNHLEHNDEMVQK